jgi:hypothetical protein
MESCLLFIGRSDDKHVSCFGMLGDYRYVNATQLTRHNGDVIRYYGTCCNSLMFEVSQRVLNDNR